jgi:hypothetical protein
MNLDSLSTSKDRDRIPTVPGLKLQRRKLTRRSFHANVRALPLDGRDEVTYGVTADISEEGLFVYSDGKVRIDSFLLLRIYAPHGKFCGLARVIHRLDGIGFGCQFTDLSPNQRNDLLALIASRSSGSISLERKLVQN